MDNFRVARRSLPTQTVDGFITKTGKKQLSPKVVVSQRTSIKTTRPVQVIQPAQPTVQYHPKIQEVQEYVQEMEAIEPTEVAMPEVAPEQAAPARLPNLDLNLDEAPARPKNRLTAGRKFRKWLLRGGLVTLALLMGTGGLLFAQGYGKVHKVFKGTASHAVALQSNVNPTLLKGEGDGRVNILLLGNGGDGHDGPDLTDTMMVASIDPVNKTAALLSVPRDLWAKMPNNYIGANEKINAAYETGKYKYLNKIDSSNANSQAVEAGFASADQVVSEVLGIPIHYNLVVDFAAFRQAVDSVGGITVDVPTELYDPTMEWENNYNPVLASPGVQQMNGVKALLYARSRETTSDFARGQRQRAIILALKDKILTLGTLSNPVKISQLMSAFGDNMVTDLSLSDAVRLYDLTKGISNASVQSLDLVTAPNSLVTTANLNGISIDEPKAGLDDYTDIQAFVRSSLKDGYLVKENSPVMVLNGTAQAGLATTKSDVLKSYGYNVTTVGNAPTQMYPKTVVVDLTNGADKYTKHYLENRYGVTAVTKLPDASIQPGTAHFVVILGNDQL
jgi:LCP family protein required for cell wall assembly